MTRMARTSIYLSQIKSSFKQLYPFNDVHDSHSAEGGIERHPLPAVTVQGWLSQHHQLRLGQVAHFHFPRTNFFKLMVQHKHNFLISKIPIIHDKVNGPKI